jgi:hypothetical protein
MPLGYRGGLWAARRGVACGSGVRKVVVGSYQDAGRGGKWQFPSALGIALYEIIY